MPIKAAGLSVDGIEDVQRLLEKQVPKQANNILRATIHGIAAEITKEAKRNVVQGKTRKLKRAIKTKRRRSPPDKPVSEVFITTGKGAAHDAFYWRFVEYGTGGGKGSHSAKQYQHNAQPFLRPAQDKISAELPRIVENTFKKKLQAAAKREQKKRQKRSKR